MQKIILLKGLPASGKTTWADKYCKENLFVERLSKDEIRIELGSPAWSREFEQLVVDVQREKANKILSKGFSLIIDDTNLNDIYTKYWEDLAKLAHIGYEEIFFDVSVEECIARDSGRKNPVGKAVIEEMYNKYLRPKTNHTDMRKILEQNDKLDKCIIVDLDGTLALHNGRNPFDYKKCYTDLVNTPVAELVRRYEYLYDSESMETDGESIGRIIIISGREDFCKELTESWLIDNKIPFDLIFMRETGDRRKDDIVKKEIYEREIKDKYFVEFVLDDRDQVVSMWRDLGLLCLQVYYGNF